MTPANTGILLAGGRSSRMGSAKALLQLDGDALLTHVARALEPHCDELVLSVATEEHAPADFVSSLTDALAAAGAASVTVVRDREPHQGPVGGLAAGLDVARGEWAFVTGCDSPFLAPRLVEGLLARGRAREGLDVVLPVREGRPEPLLAAYRPATMSRHFEAQLEAGGGSPTRDLEAVRVERLDEDALRALDPSGASFVNVNDPDDYRRARERLAERGP